TGGHHARVGARRHVAGRRRARTALTGPRTTGPRTTRTGVAAALGRGGLTTVRGTALRRRAGPGCGRARRGAGAVGDGLDRAGLRTRGRSRTNVAGALRGRGGPGLGRDLRRRPLVVLAWGRDL